MPVKKRRIKKPVSQLGGYAGYRRRHFAQQPKGDVNFRQQKIDGNPFDKVMVEPKEHHHFKDIWHCPSYETARRLVQEIAKCSDVTYIELRGKLVKVDFDSKVYGAPWEIEGQTKDPRQTVKGT